MINSADLATLPPALDRALGAFPDRAAARAAGALRKMLSERLATSEPHQWSSSRLTGDGYPVELTVTTADDRLRYTVEPASCQDTPRRRLDVAIRLMNALATSAVPDDLSSEWRNVQSLGTLGYGAWVAGRHGPADDEFKIYVEMPALDAAQCAAGHLRPRLPDRTPRLRMVGYSPSTRRHEVYYRIASLAPYHLPRVLAPAGLEARSQELQSYLADAYGHPLGERLPGASVGVSYSMQPGGEPQSATLFFFARVFWGDDARIRERFGCFARSAGWDDGPYQRVTAGLASRHAWTTRHGILGITLARGGPLSLSIGVRPPQEPSTDVASASDVLMVTVPDEARR